MILKSRINLTCIKLSNLFRLCPPPPNVVGPYTTPKRPKITCYWYIICCNGGGGAKIYTHVFMHTNSNIRFLVSAYSVHMLPSIFKQLLNESFSNYLLIRISRNFFNYLDLSKGSTFLNLTSHQIK